MYGFVSGMAVTAMQVIHDELLPGDANVDGVFDQVDLVQVLAASRYRNGDRVAWSQGDWNADGVFNQLDIIAALPNYGAAPVAATVPEPSGFVLCGLGLTVVLAMYFCPPLGTQSEPHCRF